LPDNKKSPIQKTFRTLRSSISVLTRYKTCQTK